MRVWRLIAGGGCYFLSDEGHHVSQSFLCAFEHSVSRQLGCEAGIKNKSRGSVPSELSVVDRGNMGGCVWRDSRGGMV